MDSAPPKINNRRQRGQQQQAENPGFLLQKRAPAKLSYG
jgi:hypothetical protein